MGQNMTDIHFSAVEMHRGDQPVLVAADVENDPVVEFIGGGEDLPQFGKTFEFGLLHDLVPTQERRPAVGILLPKLDQRFAGNDVHGDIISQFEIIDKGHFLIYRQRLGQIVINPPAGLEPAGGWHSC
jgi:hypothetical protein